MDKNKLLIIKIIVASLAVIALVFFIFFFITKEKDVILSPDDVKVRDSMLQIKTIAETFKNDNGFYNNSNQKVDVDFCKLDENNFMGIGNGHILCSNIMNKLNSSIKIKINEKGETNSKYCIIKELSSGSFWCMDYEGYFDVANLCDENYQCK